ncbi:hypothetical protein [Haliangium sp.]|uniref:hypothetical protein n=1 Tax=Haliangium sp. TaxID=2663208 RepID=UPI003D0A116B
MQKTFRDPDFDVAVQQRGVGPAPGKVTPTQRLPAPSVQRSSPAGATGPRSQLPSLADFTNDPWMDAAHRGVVPSAPVDDAPTAANPAPGAVQFAKKKPSTTVANKGKIGKTDLRGIVGKYQAGTTLMCTLNGVTIGKFSATGGKHAEARLIHWLNNNWDKLVEDGTVKQKDNRFVVRLTRSPCGAKDADCGGKLRAFIKSKTDEGYGFREPRIAIASMYRKNLDSSRNSLRKLKSSGTKLETWDIEQEMADDAPHLNVDSINGLSAEELEELNTKRDDMQMELDELDEEKSDDEKSDDDEND